MIRKDVSGSRVALAWYRREEWEKLRVVAADVGELEATYDKWLAHARMALREADRAGVEVVKVEMVVDALVAWCKEKGLVVNGGARARYAAEKARESTQVQPFIKKVRI